MGIGFVCLECKFSGCLGWRGDRDGWAVIRSRHRQPETFAKPATDGALVARQHRSKPAMRCLISVGGSRCRSILGFRLPYIRASRQPETLSAGAKAGQPEMVAPRSLRLACKPCAGKGWVGWWDGLGDCYFVIQFSGCNLCKICNQWSVGGSPTSWKISYALFNKRWRRAVAAPF